MTKKSWIVISLVVAAAIAATLITAFPAEAGCKRMAFSVNDYGKDGPTKDSQDLLDKHIAAARHPLVIVGGAGKFPVNGPIVNDGHKRFGDFLAHHRAVG